MKADDPVDYEALEKMYKRYCKACRHYRPESGASGVYTYGKCVRIHTNANKALFWSHPIQEEVDYLPGDEVQVYEDFGCVLFESKEG
jgi:hypothetical protein